MMTQLLRQVALPTGLLYIFVVLTQIATGAYKVSGIELPASFTLIYIFAFYWIVGWWLRADSSRRGVSLVSDIGLLLTVAWPLVLPYYLSKSRGSKGLLAILYFVATYIGATIIGALFYFFLAT